MRFLMFFFYLKHSRIIGIHIKQYLIIKNLNGTLIVICNYQLLVFVLGSTEANKQGNYCKFLSIFDKL